MIAVIDHEQMLAAATEEVREAVGIARRAQVAWAGRSVASRARLIGQLRPLLAGTATELAHAAASVAQRPLAEKLVSEVLPLLEACRFLQKNAAWILRSKRHRTAGRPLWLPGSSFEVFRKPHGVVLIVGPRNYPLFIPAVQMLQALAAGNAVVLKPAEGASEPIAEFLDRVLRYSAIPMELIQILPEDPQAARAAVQFGIDKAIFTGSSQNGRDFLAHLAKQNTPSVMELSGADTVFVRADADVDLAAKAIAFGSRLNDGNTCMAPHSIVVHQAVADRLSEAMRGLGLDTNLVMHVRNDDEALEIAAFDEHGLGAAIFSQDEAAARNFALRLGTGFATINDIIVPTADPRFPFGGVRGSGFGVTRGAEGLLEMSYPQAIAVRRSRFLPHLQEPNPDDAELFAAFAEVTHARGFTPRFRALRKLVARGRRRMISERKHR